MLRGLELPKDTHPTRVAQTTGTLLLHKALVQSGSEECGKTTPSTSDLTSALTGPSSTHFSDWRTLVSLSLTTATWNLSSLLL